MYRLMVYYRPAIWMHRRPSPRSASKPNIEDAPGKRLSAIVADVEADAAIPEKNKGDHLAYQLVMGGYRQRSGEKRMTGEWIVFAKQPHGNVYLTLANHADGDEVILARTELAAAEFPDLNWRA